MKVIYMKENYVSGFQNVGWQIHQHLLAYLISESIGKCWSFILELISIYMVPEIGKCRLYIFEVVSIYLFRWPCVVGVFYTSAEDG